MAKLRELLVKTLAQALRTCVLRISKDQDLVYLRRPNRNIRVLGSVKLNGIIINEFPLKGPEWNSALSKSKFNNSNEYPYLGDKRWYDFGKFSEGFICFQDHPGKAYFKNIKIRELR